MIKRILSKIKDNKEVRNAGWLIGGKIAQMVVSFCVNILTARYLGPSNYGIIYYAVAYVAFFTSLCTLGLDSVIVRDFIDNPNEQGKTIGTAIAMRAVSSSISVLLIFAIVSIVDRGEPLTIIVSVLCSVSLLFQVMDTFNYWFQSRYESKVTSIATFVAYTVTALYRIILLLLHKNVKWFAFATSVDYICLGAILLYVYKKHNGPTLAFSWSKGKNLLSRSYHYILSGMMVAIYGQTDRLMLKQMLDESTVGYYSLASSLSNLWVFVLQAIIDSMYPTIVSLYGRDKAQFEKKNRQLYAIVIYTAFFVAIGYSIFAPILIRLLYGEAYLPAINPLRIITWYTIFAYLGVARNAWIICENKQKYLKYMYLSAVFINIALNYFMIPLWGASGAALASVITQICTSMILPCFWKGMRPNVKLMLEALMLKGLRD